MGELTRKLDWSKTSIGTPDEWPQSLRTMVSVILRTKFPMFIWWGEDLIQFYNDAYRPSLGNEGKHPTALGQKGKDCWPEIWEVIYPLIDQVRSKGESTWSENQLIPIYRNGKMEDVYWTFGYSPITGESGKVEGVLVVCTETTHAVESLQQQAAALKRIEESENELRKSEGRLRSVFTAAPAPIVLFTGKDLVIEMPNQAFLDVFGKGNDIAGKRLAEAMPELLTENQPFLQILQEVYRSGKMYLESGALIKVVRNGVLTENYYDVAYTPLFDAEGKVYAILDISIDATDQMLARHKIEEVVAERTKELGAVNRHLEQSNAELRQFAYIASHDLQEPLRKVLTFAEMLEKTLGEMDDRSRSYLNRINTSSKRMLKLIRDVLAYSQLARENDVFEAVNLQEVVESIKSDLELLIEQKGARIECKDLPTLDAIPLQMSQLFNNLVSNALKYTREGVSPELYISASILPAGDSVNLPQSEPTIYYKIEFKDNGIGFQQEHSEQIFNIFQRLHGRAQYTGTGIGLAMCKKIADNHRGIIYAQGSPGEGATFYVILPARQREYVPKPR